MTCFTHLLRRNLNQLAKTLLTRLVDVWRFVGLCLCPNPTMEEVGR
jgi:hypothetical protein